MESQITKFHGQATQAFMKSNGYSEITSEHNNWILSLKAKSEVGKEQFEKTVKQLTEKLEQRQEKDTVKDDDIDMNNKNDQASKKFDNPTEILKIRLKNTTDKNKEKARLLSLYTRNAMVIEEAFRVMQEGSGIDKIDEVVSSFVNYEEQAYQLWNYVNTIDQESDKLEDHMSDLDKEIAHYERLACMNKK